MYFPPAPAPFNLADLTIKLDRGTPKFSEDIKNSWLYKEPSVVLADQYDYLFLSKKDVFFEERCLLITCLLTLCSRGGSDMRSVGRREPVRWGLDGSIPAADTHGPCAQTTH